MNRIPHASDLKILSYRSLRKPTMFGISKIIARSYTRMICSIWHSAKKISIVNTSSVEYILSVYSFIFTDSRYSQRNNMRYNIWHELLCDCQIHAAQKYAQWGTSAPHTACNEPKSFLLRFTLKVTIIYRFWPPFDFSVREIYLCYNVMWEGPNRVAAKVALNFRKNSFVNKRSDDEHGEATSSNFEKSYFKDYFTTDKRPQHIIDGQSLPSIIHIRIDERKFMNTKWR